LGVTCADPRDARIAELEAELAIRDARIAALEAQLQLALERIAELEAKLAQNSTNSSKPPSSDPPGVVRRPAAKPTGRKPGGQPGHKGHKRELLPVEQVDRVVRLEAKQCGRCQGPVAEKTGAPEPWRHQVTEMPPVKPHVTEYQQCFGHCAACDAWTAAPLPAEVSPSAFGPRLTALVALLSGQYHLSKRLVQDLLSNVLGVELSLGSVSKLENNVSAALEQPVAQARQHVQGEFIAHMDETGWREGRRKAWLWVAVTSLVTVFLICRSRGAAVAKEVLGEEFTGFLVTDRWSAYGWADLHLRQVCWSHLMRDFQGFVDRGGESAQLGKALLRLARRMFRWWHRVRDGTLPRRTFEHRMRAVEREVGRLLRRAAVCPDKKTAGMAKKMLKLEPAFWTFVQVEGLEPTNNAAERAIRPTVLYRKNCFGTHSPEGSRFVERMLTVVATLKQQKRNVLEFLTTAYDAHLRGLPPPALVPAPPVSLSVAA
jgi:transposase